MTRFCSPTWTPGVDTICWRALERLSVRRETRTSLQRMIGGDMSSALRELARAGMVRAQGYGAGSRGWDITAAGRSVLAGHPVTVETVVETLAQGAPVCVGSAGRRSPRRALWLLGCGIHESLVPHERCLVCDSAHAATLVALDAGAIERQQRMTARTTLAMTRRQEAHGTTAGAQVPGYRPPRERKAS